MAVTNQQIFDFLLANPNISDADLAAVMDAYGVSPQQVAQATGTSEVAAQQRYEAVTAPPPPVYEPVYQPVYEEPVYQPVYEAPVMTNTYFQANPDVAAAYASNSWGMSPDAYADFHWNNYGKNEQRVSPSGVAPTPVAAPVPQYVYQAPVEVYTPPAETNYNPEPVYSAPEPVYQPVYEAPVYQPVIPTARGTVIEGDNIEEQIAGIPQVVYETRVDPNNTANWETYNPKTGEVIDRGTFAGGGDKGLLAAAAPVIALAGSTVGLPFISGLIGGATGLTGAELAAATGGAIGGGSQLVTGNSAEDIAKAAILGAAGGYIGNQGTNALANTNVQELNAASDLASNMADQGMSLGQINQTLQSVGYQPDVITSALEDAANIISTQTPITQTSTPINQVTTPVSDTVTITGNAPVNLSNVISTIGSTIPDNQTVEIVDKTEKTQQPVIDTSALNNTATNVTTPTNLDTVEVVSNNPNTLDLNSVINLINSGNLDTTNLVSNVADTTKVTDTTTDTTKKDDKLSTGDVIRLVSAGSTLAAIDAANQGTDTGTQFPIIPIPEDWKGQPPTVIAPRPKLQPIDFGSRNLLQGTQWEKFLSPTYGQVPAPVQYSRPSNMSYNDLISILGSKQGYPSSGNLSINDIISGIQNQYGQTPTRTMG